MQYERRVGRWLQSIYGTKAVLLGQWFQFEDEHGPGKAQPDAVVLAEWPIVVEIKRTHCLDAAQQLQWTYAPLLSAHFAVEAVAMVAICENWVGPPERTMLGSLKELPRVRPGHLAYLHLPFKL